MGYRSQRFFPFLLIIIFGCTSLSDQEIISLVSQSIKEDLPPTCRDLKDFNVDKIGNKQSDSSSNWYPVRINAVAECLRLPKSEEEGIPIDFLFPNEETYEMYGVQTTIFIEYRFQKNEYGEWEAILRQ